MIPSSSAHLIYHAYLEKLSIPGVFKFLLILIIYSMFFSFFASVLDRPETLDLPVPRSALGAQFDLLHVCILIRCPELGQKFIKRHCYRRLRCQAYFTGIKIILNRIGIAKLVILFLRVIINADTSRYRSPVSPLKRL